MGFFDRFRKRIKEVADDIDVDSLTADEESEEAQDCETPAIPLPPTLDTGLSRAFPRLLYFRFLKF